MKLKENSFILTIVLLPFILLLGIMKMKNSLQGSIYSYLLIIMIIAFVISFIFSSFFALDEIINSKNRKRLIYLILAPFIYLPIYYTKYIYKNEKVIGYGVALANIMLIVSLLITTKGFVNDYTMHFYHKNFKIKDTYSYVATNNLFSVKVNNNFRCNRSLGDYVIACDNKEDDSFLGIYSYEKDTFSDGELDDIINYHKEQTINYIRENNYHEYIEDEGDLIKINYSNMVVLIERIVYYGKNKTYCLIAIKEVSSDNVNVYEFEKSIQNIEFLV